MHLSNIQISQILSPFLLATIVYVYSGDIIQNADKIFPTIQQYKNTQLDKKAAIYLKIQRDQKIYYSIINKNHLRHIKNKWIVDNLLYLAQKRKKHTITHTHLHKKQGKQKIWQLAVLYPKKKIAIINSKIVHEGSIVDGARVLKVKSEKVLLKTKGGLQWIYLFR